MSLFYEKRKSKRSCVKHNKLANIRFRNTFSLFLWLAMHQAFEFKLVVLNFKLCDKSLTFVSCQLKMDNKIIRYSTFLNLSKILVLHSFWGGKSTLYVAYNGFNYVRLLNDSIVWYYEFPLLKGVTILYSYFIYTLYI